EVRASREIPHLDERAADLGDPVRVAAGRADETALAGVRRGAAIVAGEGLARVEHLERVDGRQEPIERVAADVITAVWAVRGRDGDEARVVSSARDDILTGWGV